MHFMNTLETGEVPMELKYCERCGGLWLRRQGEDVVYCRGCQEHMAAYRRGERPIPERRRSRKRAQHGQDPIEVPAGVAGIEVRP
jgi:Zn-finger nucleic acid-binding protein